MEPQSQADKSYAMGFSAGLSRGERLSASTTYYRDALNKIRLVMKNGGFMFDNDELSNKGLRHRQIADIHSIVITALGISDEET